MPSLSTLLVVLAAAAASPVLGNPIPNASNDIVIVSRGDSKADSKLGDHVLELCDKAHNCEIYDDPIHGKSIRFVPGTEPGTAAYNATVLASEKQHGSGNNTILQARDSSDYTRIQAGYNILNYGNVQPQVVMNNLYNPCQESSCDPSPQYYGTKAVRDGSGVSMSGTMIGWYSVIFTAEGQYNGWNDRNNFIEVIKAMSEKGQSWTWQHWEHGTYIPSPSGGWWDWSDRGDQWEIRQSDFFSVNRWSPEGYMKGYMTVHVSADWGDKKSWGCERVNAFLKDVVSAINPWAGSFFGFLDPKC